MNTKPASRLSSWLRLAALVALSASGRYLFVAGKAVPLEPDNGRLLIRYYGPELTFPFYQAADVITSWANQEEQKAPVIAPEKFKDRVVFVAMGIAGNEDLVSTPLSARMPGVELHATVCANLLSGEFLRRPRAPLRYALVLFAGILGGGEQCVARVPGEQGRDDDDGAGKQPGHEQDQPCAVAHGVGS